MTLAHPKPARRGRKPPRPIARGGRPPHQRETPRAAALREGDALWRRLVKARAGGVCERRDLTCCGPLDAHHLFRKKTTPQIRLVLENGVALCRRHHDEAHLNSEAFAEWFRLRNPEAFERLWGHAISRKRVDVFEQVEQLRRAA
jgi:hypothetical protein